MTPIGLDLSLTSTGLVVEDTMVAISSKFKGMERLKDLRQQITTIIRAKYLSEPTVVLVEGYSFGSTTHAHATGELGGVVRLAMYEYGIPFLDVPPSNLKKFATGKGNCSKPEVASAISARTGIVFSGKGADDIIDAWVLREMGLEKMGLSTYTWPKVNLESFDKLDWTSVGL